MRHRIKWLNPGVRDTIRVRQRIQYGKFHARNAQLRDHASVHELDERVDDALRMHNDLDPVIWNPEQKVRLDDLERLVRTRRAVDGDLAAHTPRRVAEGVFERRFLESVGRPFPERST